MNQYDAINKITEAAIKDGLVDACFLKGSIARGQEDKYSDVDLYFIVSNENKDIFLKKRIQYLETYQNILYYSFVNFVGPQIVCIYENGLHVDLYTLTLDNINEYDNILVIHDPYEILKNYQAKPLSLTDSEIGKLINEFSYTLTEFYNAYKRKDLLFSFKLANYLHSDYTQLKRAFVDANNSKIASKGFLKHLEGDELKQYLNVTRLVKYDTSLVAVKMLVILLNDLIINLPISIAEHVNIDFFFFCKKLINSLNEE